MLLPILGILMGGIYSFPAMRLTKERDPWLTLLLAVGLAVTVFGLGCPVGTPVEQLAVVWAVSILLLLAARMMYGGLGHSLERFGIVHMATLLILFAVLALNGVKREARNSVSAEIHVTDAICWV